MVHTRRASPSTFTTMYSSECHQRKVIAIRREMECLEEYNSDQLLYIASERGAYSGAMFRIVHRCPNKATRLAKRHLAEDSMGSKSDAEPWQICAHASVTQMRRMLEIAIMSTLSMGLSRQNF